MLKGSIVERTQFGGRASGKTAAKTARAQAFIMANRKSPVVEGAAIGAGGPGASYKLKNGQSFRLTREECEQVGTMRWQRNW